MFQYNPKGGWEELGGDAPPPEREVLLDRRKREEDGAGRGHSSAYLIPGQRVTFLLSKNTLGSSDFPVSITQGLSRGTAGGPQRYRSASLKSCKRMGEYEWYER